MIGGYALIAVISLLINDSSNRNSLKALRSSYDHSVQQYSYLLVSSQSRIEELEGENRELRETLILAKQALAAADLSVYDEVETDGR